MDHKKQTLLRYLRKENPKLTLMELSSKGNTTTKSDSGWGWPAEIEDWSYFEFENLKRECEDLLQREFSFPYLHPPSALPFLEIHDEGSFEVVLIKWNHSIVSEALAKTQEWDNDGSKRPSHLEKGEPNGTVYMVKGGQAELVPPRKTNKKKRGKPARPDWGGIKRLYKTFDKNQKYWNILPGETKLSVKWQSKDITLGKVFPEFNHRKHYPKTTRSSQYDQLWLPLRQIFSYCTRLERRYGYIITDQELVVIKIDPYSQYNSTDGRTIGRIEFKSIPWNNDGCPGGDGSLGMTVNLALWWLYTMANNDERLDWPQEPPEEDDEPVTASGVTPRQLAEDSTLVSETPVESFRSEVSQLRRGMDGYDITESDESSDDNNNNAVPPPPSKGKKKRQSEKAPTSYKRVRKGTSGT